MRKAKFILTIITIILFCIVIVLGYFIIQKYVLMKNFADDVVDFANKNQSTVFYVNSITFFSSADAAYKTNTANNFTIQNLYQYTDIALYIRSNSDEDTLENTLKEVYIDNIKFSNTPNLGEPNLYFKSINDFATSTITEENLIEDSFEFTVSSSDETDLSSPILYNNLANPLTFSYINSNIVSDYTFTDVSSSITYDGSLLERCGINLEDLNCTLSFNIYITNNLDEKFKTTVVINIPLSTEDNTIFDGSIILDQDVNYAFYRYE